MIFSIYLFVEYFKMRVHNQTGSWSEWHSDKMTRSSNRHSASLLHGGSLWHNDKMTWCVNLAQRQNDTMRHFGTATKCLSFFFLILF